jgi:Zn-dependent peptidase ImmA (M78 family)/DNA-binding XRE family transcriptional regulator
MGLSLAEAARKTGVSTERLAAWESGDEAPTINQLRTLARVYKRPLAVFYLPEPPRRFDAMRDFRRLPEGRPASLSPELNLEIRRSRVRREVMLELAHELGLRVPQLRFDAASYKNDPDRLADAARSLLRVDLADQYGWRDKYKALNSWIAAVEHAGALVFQTGEIDLRETRGFSLYEPVLPVIVVNAQDSPRGRVFTILHEFTHILLHSGGLCDLHEHGQPDTEDERIEVFCNRVAGAMLVPENALRSELGRTGPQALRTSLDDTISQVSRQFSVSQEVVLRRLLTIGLVSRAVYQKKREDYMKAYQKEKATEGFASPSTMAIRDLGKRFVRVVVDAYRQETITSADLSDFLGVRLKHLPRIEQAVFRAEA